MTYEKELDALAAWNNFCEEASDANSFIYEMDEINRVLGNEDPQSIINMVFYGDFNPCSPFFRFDGYGKLQSGELEDLADLEDPAFKEWIADNYCPF